MFRFPKFRLAAGSTLLLAAVGALIAVSSSSCDKDELIDLLVEVRMAPGGMDYSPSSTYTINGTAVSFSTLRFYMHDPGVSDGTTTMSTDAYVLAAPSSAPVMVGQVFNDDYDYFTFNLGIDSVTNHADPSTYVSSSVLAPQTPNMHWSWSSGYIFLRIDGMFDADGDGTPESPFETHLGTDNFYTPIMVSGNVEDDGDHLHVELVFDPIKLFDGFAFASDPSDPMTVTTHTMDNMPLAMTMRGNLSSAFSLE